MQLEDYFDFLAPNDIRIKGSRIGIETVLYDFIHRARTPEQIAADYWSIDLEQVYATILYYLHNKEAVHQYVTDWLEFGERMREEQEKNPDPVILRTPQAQGDVWQQRRSRGAGTRPHGCVGRTACGVQELSSDAGPQHVNYRLAHSHRTQYLCRSFGDIAGSKPGSQHRIHRALDGLGFFFQSQRVPQ